MPRPDDREREVVALIPHLRRYALALLGNRAAADDLVQDCLERAWSRLAQRRETGSLRGWLFTIMHNLFVNDLARRRARPAEVELEAEPPVDGGQENRVEISDLARAILRLPPPQRSVLVLVAIEEMSYEEVARLLDVPVGTVMSRLHRARERLAEMGAGRARPTLRRVK